MTVALDARRAGSTRRADARRLRLTPPPGQRTGPFLVLLAAVAVLVLFGLVMVLSSSSLIALEEKRSTWSYAGRQAAWAALGSLGLCAALWTDRRRWRRWCRVGLVGVVFLLAVVLVTGPTINGARRWLGIGDFQVQPSELAKIAIILFAADLLAGARRPRSAASPRSAPIEGRSGRPDPRTAVAPVIGALSVVSVLVLVEPNLGTTVILAAIVIAMIYVSGARVGWLLGLAAAAVASAALLVWFVPYRRRRLFAVFDPWANGSDSGYQTVQAGVGLSDGGLTGLGLGQSKAKWGYLPFAHTDFIFAIIGEEFGLVGALTVVLLFVVIAVIGVRIALVAEDRFSMLVAAGITAWLVSQAFLNIGVVLSLVPNTGVPLPFISYGGSSLLVTMVAVGMLLNIARHPRLSAEDNAGGQGARGGRE